MKAIAAVSFDINPTMKLVLGKDGKIPWNIPEDLKFFKEKTLNGTVIMGRKTFESLGKPLPKRYNIVISNSKEFKGENLITYKSITDIPSEILNADNTWLIGGETLYNQLLPLCTDLFLTFIKEQYEGDTFFPEYYDSTFVQSEVLLADNEHYMISHYTNKNL